MVSKTYLWDAESDSLLSDAEAISTTAVYTNEPHEFGGLVSQSRSGTTSAYHFDARGDTRELTNDVESVTDSKVYDAWGNVLESTGSTVMPFQFGGELGYNKDVASEGYYIRARYYQAIVARWTTRDPLIAEPDSSTKPYQYCGTNPINSIDPSGNRPLDVPFYLSKPKSGPMSGHIFIDIGGDRTDSSGLPCTEVTAHAHIRRNWDGAPADEYRQQWNDVMKDFEAYYPGYEGTDSNGNTWFFPNLAALLSSSAPRYSWDTGEGANDYLELSLDVSGCRSVGGSELFGTVSTWHPVGEPSGVARPDPLDAVYHVAGSDKVTVCIPTCCVGTLKARLTYADPTFGGGRQLEVNVGFNNDRPPLTFDTPTTTNAR